MRASALAVALLPAAALAQGTDGTISGTLDFDDATWSVLETGALPASSWKETDSGIAVEIVGYPEAEPTDTESAMTLSFTIPGGATDSAAAENAMLVLNQSSGPVLTASKPNLELALTNAAVEGDRLAVAGNLNATLTYGVHNEMILDPGADTRTFAGDFQATITRASE